MARGRKVRVAYGRIGQETNAFSPVQTTMEDFRRTHFLEGAALEAACRPRGVEAKGFTRNAELSGFVKAARAYRGRLELVPLFSAWTVPGGPLSADTFAELRERLDDALVAAGPIDGLFLSLHGAMRAVGTQEDPEAVFLADVRRRVGDIPLGVSLDLHANLTPEKVGPVDVLAGYHTNPHRDHAATGYRVGRALLATVLGQAHPTTAWRFLPMVLGGGATVDVLPPMWSVFRRLRALERDRRVLTASLFMCHLWNDSPDLGWATHVVTDGDQALADRLAEELADQAWAVRHKMPPRFATAEEAIADIRRARLRRRLGTALVSDTSDAVGAGGTGENTNLLAALLEHGQGLLSYVPLRAPDVVAKLWELDDGDLGDGARELPWTVGGKLDPKHNPPLEIAGRLVRKRRHHAFGRMAVLEVGDVRLVLTENTPLAMKPAFYQDVGLNPWKADIVVAKSFFPFRLFFLPMNRKTVYVRTRGITDVHLVETLPLNQPTHPMSPVAHWRPADKQRRGV